MNLEKASCCTLPFNENNDSEPLGHIPSCTRVLSGLTDTKRQKTVAFSGAFSTQGVGERGAGRGRGVTSQIATFVAFFSSH